ncbi:MAG: nitroreductase family protein [Nitrospinota bacterium]
MSPAFDLFAALEGRRSVRRFAPRPVPGELVEEVLRAACLAPSPHGAMPWRFALVESAAAKARLAEAMGRDFLRDMERDGVPEEERRRRHEASLRLLKGAPLLLLASITLEGLDVYPDVARQEAERTMAAQSLGAALQNLMLAAYARGLGSLWRCAPLFCPETVRRALELPADHIPQALILLGYPHPEWRPAPKGAPAPSPQVLRR